MKKLFLCWLAASAATLTLVSCAPNIPPDNPSLSNAALIASQLPANETPSNAPLSDLEIAVQKAIDIRPAAAADIVRLALLAKTDKNNNIDCNTVLMIISQVLLAHPDQASQISEMAQSVAPQCNREIVFAVTGKYPPGDTANATASTTVPGSTSGTNADGTSGASGDGTSTTTGADGDGFGAGFGPGFPGSPTFSGSSPSGGFALPPLPPTVTVPVTTVVND